jgi:hypothetical protein
MTTPRAWALLELIRDDVHVAERDRRPVIRIELHPEAEALLVREVDWFEARELHMERRLFGSPVLVRVGRQYNVVVGEP